MDGRIDRSTLTALRRWTSKLRDASAPWSDALGVALLGALARTGAVVWAAGRFPPAADGDFYHVIAGRIARGHGYTWLWPDGAVTYAAHYPVGYPALVGAAYAGLGANPIWAMILNALLGTLAVIAVHRIAATVSNRGGALLAGTAVALHPGLVAYTPALMTEGVAAALLALDAWLALVAARAVGKRRVGAIAALGIGIGVSTLVRPQLILIAPVFGFLAGVDPAERTGAVLSSRRRVLLSALATTLVAVAVCLPWTVRNCASMDRCVFVSANAGWNLLIGSSEGATGSWIPLEGERVPPACRDVLGEASKDACFGRAALEGIAAKPLEWLALVPDKLAVTFDYAGAAGWYLHESNRDAFDERDKLQLGVAESVWQRLLVALALVALARAAGPRARARIVLGGIGILLLFTRSAWPSYALLVVSAASLGSVLVKNPPALMAAASVATTGLTHAVFFGAGRYSLVCFAVLAALAGAVLPAGRAAFDSPLRPR
jgi:hypothetical protein